MRNKEMGFQRALFYGFVAIASIFSLTLACAVGEAAPSDVFTVAPIEGSAATPASVTVYELIQGSNYNQGCVGPCLCPVQIVGPMSGTFDLVPLAPSPLFNRFSVNKIRWTVTDSSGKTLHKITGNGFYEVGGEVARTQQMVLQLSIDGAQPAVFDSGLVPEITPFPDIAIRVMRGTCFAVWLNINAIPKY